jgi:hypothetical protein
MRRRSARGSHWRRQRSVSCHPSRPISPRRSRLCTADETFDRSCGRVSPSSSAQSQRQHSGHAAGSRRHAARSVVSPSTLSNRHSPTGRIKPQRRRVTASHAPSERRSAPRREREVHASRVSDGGSSRMKTASSSGRSTRPTGVLPGGACMRSIANRTARRCRRRPGWVVEGARASPLFFLRAFILHMMTPSMNRKEVLTN